MKNVMVVINEHSSEVFHRFVFLASGSLEQAVKGGSFFPDDRDLVEKQNEHCWFLK